MNLASEFDRRRFFVDTDFAALGGFLRVGVGFGCLGEQNAIATNGRQDWPVKGMLMRVIRSPTYNLDDAVSDRMHESKAKISQETLDP